MKKLIFILIAALVAVGANAATRLKFKNDGSLKIVQFTDAHLIKGNKQYDDILSGMLKVLDIEKPDVVIFTGDQVYSDGTQQSLQDIIDVVMQRNIPYAMVFGNHDYQFDMTLDDMYDFIASSSPRCLMPERKESGKYDYVIEVESAFNPRTKYLLYCMDTHSGNPISKNRGYDWLKSEQIEWYRDTGDKYRDNNRGDLLPSMLFIHIPLPEYASATQDGTVNRVTGPMIGNKGEKVCHSALNTGMFMTMHHRGDVRAVFCGHDHDNDFTIDMLGILLGYGRFTGIAKPYGKLPNGARVIEINENDPDVVNTWIREANGSEAFRQSFRYRYVPDTKEAVQ